MGVDFIGNPYEQDELGDSDFEGTAEDDWITLPNDMVILDGREQADNVLDPTFGLPDSSDEDTWLDEVDDEDDDYDPAEEDYSNDEDNPDDENYEVAAELEDIAADFFFDDTDSDEEDDEYDYVTFPLNAPVSNTGSSPEIVKTTSEEINTNNPDNADAD